MTLFELSIGYHFLCLIAFVMILRILSYSNPDKTERRMKRFPQFHGDI